MPKVIRTQPLIMAKGFQLCPFYIEKFVDIPCDTDVTSGLHLFFLLGQVPLREILFALWETSF